MPTTKKNKPIDNQSPQHRAEQTSPPARSPRSHAKSPTEKYVVEVMVRTNHPHPGEMDDVYEARHKELPDALMDAYRQQRAAQRRHPGVAVMAHVTMDSEALLHLG